MTTAPLLSPALSASRPNFVHNTAFLLLSERNSFLRLLIGGNIFRPGRSQDSTILSALHWDLTTPGSTLSCPVGEISSNRWGECRLWISLPKPGFLSLNRLMIRQKCFLAEPKSDYRKPNQSFVRIHGQLGGSSCLHVATSREFILPVQPHLERFPTEFIDIIRMQEWNTNCFPRQKYGVK